MKINKMTVKELQAALKRAAKSGDTTSVYVQHVSRKLKERTRG